MNTCCTGYGVWGSITSSCAGIGINVCAQVFIILNEVVLCIAYKTL